MPNESILKNVNEIDPKLIKSIFFIPSPNYKGLLLLLYWNGTALRKSEIGYLILEYFVAIKMRRYTSV